MGSIVAAAKELADQLDAVDGIRATHDPAKAATHRPCVLVPPPAMDYVHSLNTWRLVLLAGKSHGDLGALVQLDELLQLVLAELPNVETADPGSYVLTGGTDPVPAYFLRITT